MSFDLLSQTAHLSVDLYNLTSVAKISKILRKDPYDLHIFVFTFRALFLGVIQMPAKNRDEILSLLTQYKPELQTKFKVRHLALFGSYARGDQQPDSDVDILVDVRHR